MEEDVIQVLKSDDRLLLKGVYTTYRIPFISFGKRYGLNDDDLADIYQESFLALRKQAINGRLNSVQCSLKTYLFGIGKFKIFDLLKEKKQKVPYDSQLHKIDEEIEGIQLNTEMSLTTEQKLLHKHFEKLGEKCKQVLTLFYYRGLSNKEIANQAGYEKDNVVKSQKSRCLKQLKEMINGG